MKYFVIMILAAILAACSSSGPSDADLNTQMKPKLSSQLLDVVNLKKIESTPTEKNGAKVYKVKYEAEIKFKRSCEDIKKEIAARIAERNKNAVANMFNFSDKSREKDLKEAHASVNDMNLQTDLNYFESTFGSFKAGEVQKVSRSCTFSKTDNGWRLTD